MADFDWLRSADLYAHRLLERMEASQSARLTEATLEQRVATGAGAGGSWYDPIDRDYGFRPIGRHGPREVPERTREQARTDSIVASRANPMGTAILDTYVAFCVGDSGVGYQCTSEEVRPYVERFWSDPRNRIPDGQELSIRSWMIYGETLEEMMVGEMSGVCRRSPIEPARIVSVSLRDGNPLWHESVVVRTPDAPLDVESLSVIGLDDLSGLRQGQAFFLPGWRATEFDTRGYPMLGPVLDWLDDYDSVLSNLIDRSALMRYIAMDVTVKGSDEAKVQATIDRLNGMPIPRSGTQAVHNESVEFKPLQASTGSFEDTNTVGAIQTTFAAGTGLAKHWLAEPDNANRATSQTMGEPVRRRLGSVQNQWVSYQTERLKFVVDQAVRVGALPAFVAIKGADGRIMSVPAADTVTVTGPSIAATDSQITAQVMLNLSQALVPMEAAGILSHQACQLLAQKTWEEFAGVPFQPELAVPDADVNDVATAVDDASGGKPAPVLAAV